jgi:hypothetical protein
MHLASLFDEVKGYGGGVTEPTCTTKIITDFGVTICPNTANERTATKTSNFVIIYYCGGGGGIQFPGGVPGSGGGTSNQTYAEYLQQQVSGGTDMPGGYFPLPTDFNCEEGGGGTGGGDGGTGGGTGGGGTEDHRCSGNENITVGASGFYSGITVPSQGSNNIVISSPLNGTIVDKSRVIIKGAIDPNLNGAQVIIETSRPGVSGIDSSFPANINGDYFAALVPLLEGENIIKAKAQDLNGNQIEASITVNASIKPEKLILTFTTPNEDFPTLKPNGLTTLDVTLKAIPYVSVARYSWDFNGDGVTDLECSKLSQVTASFKNPGLYLPTVTITDTNGNKYTDTTIVNVLSTDEMGNIFKMIWNKMRGALKRGDINSAVSYFDDFSKDAYKEMFTTLSSLLSQIAQELGDMEFIRIMGNSAECDIRTIRNGKDYSFYLLFIKGEDGIWRIRSF